MARAAVSVLSREVNFRLGAAVEASEAQGGIRIRWRGKSGEGEEVFDRVLAAAGRPPALDGLDLTAAGLHLRGDGVPEHDEATLRCGASPISSPATTTTTGRCCTRRPAGKRSQAQAPHASPPPGAGPRRRRCPSRSATQTWPASARRSRRWAVTPSSAVATSEAGRSLIEGRPGGMIRLYATREDGVLAGGEMVGPAVEHLAHLVAFLVQEKVTAERALALQFYHPCYEEDIKDCLRDLLGQLGKGTSDWK